MAATPRPWSCTLYGDPARVLRGTFSRARNSGHFRMHTVCAHHVAPVYEVHVLMYLATACACPRAPLIPPDFVWTGALNREVQGTSVTISPEGGLILPGSFLEASPLFPLCLLPGPSPRQPDLWTYPYPLPVSASFFSLSSPLADHFALDLFFQLLSLLRRSLGRQSGIRVRHVRKLAPFVPEPGIPVGENNQTAERF